MSKCSLSSLVTPFRVLWLERIDSLWGCFSPCLCSLPLTGDCFSSKKKIQGSHFSVFPQVLSSLPSLYLPKSSLFFKLFIYFWLHWVFIAVHGLQRVGATVFRWSMCFRVYRLSSCGLRALEYGFSICGSWTYNVPFSLSLPAGASFSAHSLRGTK